MRAKDCPEKRPAVLTSRVLVVDFCGKSWGCSVTTRIRFPFEPQKMVQAIGVLMRADGVGKMNYMRLLKLLYFADRESMREAGKPLTGDEPYAMEHGPVLSTTYNLMKGERCAGSEVWDAVFQTDGYDLVMVGRVGTKKLSPFEVTLLEDLAQTHRGKNQWDLRDYAHNNFGEFKKHDPRRHGLSGRERIPFEDILRSLGRRADIASITKNAEADMAAAELFG